MYHAVKNKYTGARFWVSDALWQKHSRKAMKAGCVRTGVTRARLTPTVKPDLVVANPKPDAVVVPFARPTTLTKGLRVLTYDGAGKLIYPVNDGCWWVRLDSGEWHIGRAEYLKPLAVEMERAA